MFGEGIRAWWATQRMKAEFSWENFIKTKYLKKQAQDS